jgi:hypothetical protein
MTVNGPRRVCSSGGQALSLAPGPHGLEFLRVSVELGDGDLSSSREKVRTQSAE